MTVTQTLQGYPPPIEHVGVPKVCQQEAGKCVYLSSTYSLLTSAYIPSSQISLCPSALPTPLPALPHLIIYNIWPEWQLFNVAGYLYVIEESRRSTVISLPHEDKVLNKFRIWKERHVQMRENRASRLVG